MMWFHLSQADINRLTIGEWWQVCDGIDERQKQEKKAHEDATRAARRRR